MRQLHRLPTRRGPHARLHLLGRPAALQLRGADSSSWLARRLVCMCCGIRVRDAAQAEQHTYYSKETQQPRTQESKQHETPSYKEKGTRAMECLCYFGPAHQSSVCSAAKSPALYSGALKRLSRSALLSTNTLDSAMAPAANTGDSSVPLNGYSKPAATGISATL